MPLGYKIMSPSDLLPVSIRFGIHSEVLVGCFSTAPISVNLKESFTRLLRRVQRKNLADYLIAMTESRGVPDGHGNLLLLLLPIQVQVQSSGS
jgi:hypothetical protein